MISVYFFKDTTQNLDDMEEIRPKKQDMQLFNRVVPISYISQDSLKDIARADRVQAELEDYNFDNNYQVTKKMKLSRDWIYKKDNT